VDPLRALTERLPALAASAAEPDRVAYSRDLWPRRLLDVRSGRVAQTLPAGVVWPRSTAEVAEIVRQAAVEGLPIVPFGAGSGVCGGVSPDSRTIVVDMKRMSDWSIQREAPLLDSGPGVMGITLEEDLERHGFTVGHFPSSILCSTVGGWVAARGAGQCSGLYGKIEDMVASLECVLGTGEVVTLKRRRSAPNLLPLMIGSEGTLGLITRVGLRLHAAPRARAFAAFEYGDIVRGWEALRGLFQEGLRPAVSRLYDPIDSMMMKQGSVRPERRSAASHGAARGGGARRGSNPLASVLRSALRAPALLNSAIQAAEGNLLGGCTLVLVFEGDADAVTADCERANRLCARTGGQLLGEGPARSWFQHRYSVSYRQAPVFRMGAFSDTMEVAAPWSRLETLYDDVRRALGRHVLVMAHLSHAYPDGCSIYFTFSGVGSDDDDAARRYDSAWRAALDAAIGAGGTLSHHHGVGRSKAPRLGAELGYGVEVVRALQRAWDPHGILNPGNLVPRENSDDSPAGADYPADGIDERSLLATFGGELAVSEIEARLGERGLTLGLDGSAAVTLPLAGWIAAGLPGASDAWADPVSQPIAGFVARLGSGRRLVVRPAPRRAVGPDMLALFVGAKERFGRVERATLVVRRQGAPHARALPFHHERDPAFSDGERAAWDRLSFG
jgi:alkyldihydroxyacetonephosphate synthase